MKESKLRWIFKYCTYIDVNDDWMLFDNLELYNSNTQETIQFESIEEALNFQIDNETINTLLDRIEFSFVYSGGRGSGLSGDMGGGFTNSGDNDGFTRTLFPATFNTQGRFTTQEAAIKHFEKLYGGADHEYAVNVDSQGFVHAHVEGTHRAVRIAATGNNEMMVHNHPGGGNFSRADLVNTAKVKQRSGIIATSRNKGKTTRYTFVKGPKFNAIRFIIAVKSANWPKEYSYDKGASWWLKRNAKKYGYTYSVTKM